MINYQHVTMLVGCLAFVAFVVMWAPKPLLIRVVWGYFIGHSLYFALSPWHQPEWVKPYMWGPLSRAALLVALLLIVVPRLVLMAGRWVWYLIPAFLLFDCWWLFTHDFGLMDARTFDVAVMAIWLPKLLFTRPNLKRERICLWIVAAVFMWAIWWNHGTTAAVVGVAGLLTYWALTGSWITIGLAVPVAVAAGYFYRVNINGIKERLYLWATSLDWFFKYGDPFVGVGSGSFSLIGLFFPINGKTYYSMHNDYIQCLFDYGPLGLVALLSLIGWCLYKAWNRPVLFSTIISYSVCMLTYFPTHIFISQLIGAMLIERAINGDTT